MLKIEPNKHKSLRFILSSGDNGDYPGCKLHIVFWKWSVVIDLPSIIKPDVLRVRGQYNYDDYIERQYGFYLFENHFNILYGRGDANFHRDEFGSEQRWSCFLPWGEWRHVRHSLYDLTGKLFFTQYTSPYKRERGFSYDTFRMWEEKAPKAVFKFLDFDGEEIGATTHIEEREWHRGDRWCKWLSLFFKPLIRRNLDIQFDKETGPKKGSWKGGTIGHGIEMEQNELHESAFRRYCQAHRMQLL